MFHIRTSKTGSGKTAVQILRYEKRKLVIVKHIGSANNRKEVQRLKHNANNWIEETTRQQSLFPQAVELPVVQLNQLQYVGFRYGLLYESLYEVFKRFNFHWLRNKLLLDLVIARIAQPSSKLRSIEFLKEFFGVEHGRRELYRQIPIILKTRNTIESRILEIAKKEFAFNFSFEGKKFEGHTLIPIILRFKRKHKIERLTVVADAAMISIENIKALTKVHLNYIVGARAANLPMKTIEEVSRRISGHDGATIRMQTNYGGLICEFSQKRHTKDKREMEKQITKAEKLLKNPGNIKRTKFISSEGQVYRLNASLIEKTKSLLGIKGYYTNLTTPEVNDQTVIEHYHNLWHVEQAFRISKSDLLIRPMFHFKQQMIETHILICFMALAVCKYMELKTDRSIKSNLKLLKSVTDAKLVNTLSGEQFILRSPINDEIREVLKQLEIFC